MLKKKPSADEMERVLTLPKTEINGKVSSIAHVDVSSAKIKLGGIYVAVYPIIEGEIEKPHEVRQKLIMNSVIQKEIVDFAQKKKKEKKKKASKRVQPIRTSFMT